MGASVDSSTRLLVTLSCKQQEAVACELNMANKKHINHHNTQGGSSKHALACLLSQSIGHSLSLSVSQSITHLHHSSHSLTCSNQLASIYKLSKDIGTLQWIWWDLNSLVWLMLLDTQPTKAGCDVHPKSMNTKIIWSIN